MKNMLNSESDWLTFNQEWGERYKNAKHILAYLNSYPKVLNTLKIEEIHKPDDLDDAQIDWIRLCSQFDNKIEIDFFKPYWIPLGVNSYDFFIDISDVNYPIFDINYFFYEPYRWYKKIIAADVRDILLAPDTGLDLRKIVDKNDKIRWNQVDEFFKERRRLGYEGKISIEPVNRFEIIPENSNSNLVKVDLTDTTVSVSAITSIITGLLPYDLRIDLKHIHYKYGEPNLNKDNLRLIRDLVFFLRDSGTRRVDSYQIDFPDTEHCFLKYHNDSCILNYNDSKILHGFVDALNKLR